jgi:hypothetical protein
MKQPSSIDFATSCDPARKIIFNTDPDLPFIREGIQAKELRALLCQLEEDYVDAFWLQLLCKRSPYNSELPLALASGGGLTLIAPSKVAAAAASNSRRNPADGQKTRISDYSFEELVGALLKIKPATILDAQACLNFKGRERLVGFPIVAMFDKLADSEPFIRQLTKMSLDAGGQALVLGALVAMRSVGWVILPPEVSLRIGKSIGTGKAKDREWTNPLSHLSPALKLLWDELCVPPGIESDDRQPLIESKVRLAVLCTNLQSKGDLNWLLASELLKKREVGGQTFDVPFSLRDRWRQICRQSGAPEVEPNDHMVGAPVEVGNAWPSPEPLATPTGRFFSAPDDPKFEVILNLDEEHAHILCSIGPDELLPVVSAIEQKYIDKYWDQLCTASPHVCGLPYALAGSSSGHTLIQPTFVYAEISGHKDVSATEAMRDLRRYPMSELCTSVQRLKPHSIAAALDLLSENGRIRFHGFSLVDMAHKEPSFTAYVTSLVKTARAIGYGTDKSLAQYALVALRSKGWIILPESVNHHVGRVLRGVHGAERDWAADPMEFLDAESKKLFYLLLGQVDSEDRDYSTQHCVARRAVLCTNLRSAKDLSMPLVEVLLATDAQTKEKGMAATAPASLRARWTRICEQNGPAAMRPQGRKNDHRGALVKRCPTPERLGEWLDFLAGHAERHTAGNLEPVYQGFAGWLSWLSTLDIIPGPTAVMRKHIRDDANPSANTFRAYLSKLPYTVTKSRNLPLAKMNEVFERLVAECEENGVAFHNPIRYERDRFPVPRGEKSGGTKRRSLAEWIMAELRQLIVVDKGDGRYEWGEALQKMDCLQLETGMEEKVFCPILPAITYFMLVFPMRTHGARWTDSGEMDELVYDFDSKIFIPNTNSEKAIVGRTSGVIQPSQNKPIDDKSVPDLEFQVSVNKTQLHQRNRSAFTIPYFPPDILWIVKQVLEWQKKYGPPAHLVKEVHEPTNEGHRNQQLADFYPDICPLFRYPKQDSFYPPSHSQIGYFWGKLCRLWDDKNALWKDPKTGQFGQRPACPKLSRIYTGPDGKRNQDWATYDLHSLRVSRVTALLDAGLPLGIVAAIAGHKSLAMTLHYYSAERHTLKVKLHEAFQKLGSDAGMEEIAQRLYETDEESWLRGSPDGFARLRENRRSGFLSITPSGICPGASCDTGMIDPERPSQAPTEVPGSRCPLCRYFIYGPAFLPGLAYDYNCLLFELEKKANQHVQLRNDAIEAEDAGNRGDVWRLRGEDDRLDRETSLDLRVLARLYCIIDECIDAINAGVDADKEGVALLAPSSAKLEAVMERVSKFQQLKDIVEVAQIIPASRHTAPAIAELELKDRLLDFLRRNGAECYLAGIPKETARVATLQLARLLERLVPSDDARQQLLDGITQLHDLPAVESGVLAHVDKSMRQIHAGQHQALSVPQNAQSK